MEIQKKLFTLFLLGANFSLLSSEINKQIDINTERPYKKIVAEAQKGLDFSNKVPFHYFLVQKEYPKKEIFIKKTQEEQLSINNQPPDIIRLITLKTIEKTQTFKEALNTVQNITKTNKYLNQSLHDPENPNLYHPLIFKGLTDFKEKNPGSIVHWLLFYPILPSTNCYKQPACASALLEKINTFGIQKKVSVNKRMLKKQKDKVTNVNKTWLNFKNKKKENFFYQVMLGKIDKKQLETVEEINLLLAGMTLASIFGHAKIFNNLSNKFDKLLKIDELHTIDIESQKLLLSEVVFAGNTDIFNIILEKYTFSQLTDDDQKELLSKAMGQINNESGYTLISHGILKKLIQTLYSLHGPDINGYEYANSEHYPNAPLLLKSYPSFFLLDAVIKYPIPCIEKNENPINKTVTQNYEPQQNTNKKPQFKILL